MKVAAILLTFIVLAAAGCKGERVPKPKTDTATAYHHNPVAGPLRPV